MTDGLGSVLMCLTVSSRRINPNEKFRRTLKSSDIEK